MFLDNDNTTEEIFFIIKILLRFILIKKRCAGPQGALGGKQKNGMAGMPCTTELSSSVGGSALQIQREAVNSYLSFTFHPSSGVASENSILSPLFTAVG